MPSLNVAAVEWIYLLQTNGKSILLHILIICHINVLMHQTSRVPWDNVCFIFSFSLVYAFYVLCWMKRENSIQYTHDNFFFQLLSQCPLFLFMSATQKCYGEVKMLLMRLFLSLTLFSFHFYKKLTSHFGPKGNLNSIAFQGNMMNCK